MALLAGQDHMAERLVEKGASPEFMIKLVGRPPLPAFHPHVLAITFEKTMDKDKVSGVELLPGGRCCLKLT